MDALQPQDTSGVWNRLLPETYGAGAHGFTSIASDLPRSAGIFSKETVPCVNYIMACW